MKKKTKTSEFGKRLAYFRKAKGLTQGELGEKVGVSYRVIAYYEGETKYPPSRIIVPLSKALGITTDELLGVKKTKNDFDPRNASLWRKLKVVENLPKKDQKAILHYIEMVTKNREVDQKSM
jgi:transcriptional regulator with XRE-family HTH domain